MNIVAAFEVTDESSSDIPQQEPVRNAGSLGQNRVHLAGHFASTLL